MILRLSLLLVEELFGDALCEIGPCLVGFARLLVPALDELLLVWLGNELELIELMVYPDLAILSLRFSLHLVLDQQSMLDLVSFLHHVSTFLLSIAGIVGNKKFCMHLIFYQSLLLLLSTHCNHSILLLQH